MIEKIKLINNILLLGLMVLSITLVIYLLIWLPRVSQSTIQLNNAKCLESYNNQNQPPLGACGFDF